VRAIKPPRRVTRTELERRLTMPGWLAPRAAKLPATTAMLKRITDTLEDFQARRVRWAAAHLEGQHLPVQAWRVRRLAGLRPQASQDVEIALRAVTDGTRNQAPVLQSDGGQPPCC